MSLPLPAKIALRFTRKALVYIDMTGNWLSGGKWGETISYRSAVAAREGKWPGCVMCRFLDVFQQDHCEITYRNNLKQRTIGNGQ